MKEVKVNKVLWNIMWVIMLIQLIAIAFMYDSPDKKKSRPSLDLAKVVALDYPEIVCQAGDTFDYKFYKAKEYVILPDIYDDNHFLVNDKNGSSFSTSRCAINDIATFIEPPKEK